MDSGQRTKEKDGGNQLRGYFEMKLEFSDRPAQF